MDHFKTYNDFLLESEKKEIIVYHKSNNLEHMVNCDFKLEKSHEDKNIFGKAIYFSTSPNAYWGKYCCKFSITPDEPILDFNKEISLRESNELLHFLMGLYSMDTKFNFTERVQYGQIFDITGCRYNHKK